MGSYWSDENKEQTKYIMETLLHHAIEENYDDRVTCSWKKEDSDKPRLVFETTLENFLPLLNPDKNNPHPIGSKLSLDLLSRLINQLFELEIFIDNRPRTQGSGTWLFGVQLYTKSVDTKSVSVDKNLSRLYEELDEKWKGKRSPKSKDISAKSKEANDMAHSPDSKIQPNPFSDSGAISDPDRFSGREELLRQSFEKLSNGNSLSLVGEAKVGKSSILKMICESKQARLALPPETFKVLYLDMQNVYDGEDFYSWLCQEVGIPYCRGTQLERRLKAIGIHFILCLDEIDNMAERERFQEYERRQLRGLADGGDQPVTIVTASQVPLRDVFPDSPERTSPLADLCQQIDVKPFSEKEAREFLAERLTGTGVSFSDSQTNELLVNSRCNPGLLQLCAADLYEEMTKRI